MKRPVAAILKLIYEYTYEWYQAPVKLYLWWYYYLVIFDSIKSMNIKCKILKHYFSFRYFSNLILIIGTFILARRSICGFSTQAIFDISIQARREVLRNQDDSFLVPEQHWLSNQISII